MDGKTLAGLGLLAFGVGKLLGRRDMYGYAGGLPFPGAIITSGWGRPRAYRDGTHYGADMAARVNTPVASVSESGIVDRVDHDPAGNEGRLVAVVVPIGTCGWALYRYLHLNRIDVTPGQRVNPGQQIGLSGAAASGDAHLHMDIAIGGRVASCEPTSNLFARVDPRPGKLDGTHSKQLGGNGFFIPVEIAAPGIPLGAEARAWARARGI